MGPSPSYDDRVKGCLVGLAVGDAFGTTLEFSARDTCLPHLDMVGGGPFGLKPGEWTDDTSMALCLGESLLAAKGFDAAGMMNRFVNWMEYGYNSVTGVCFDIGRTTRDALEAYRAAPVPRDGPDAADQAGNGSIMRLAPAVLFSLPSRSRAIELAVLQSRPTHAAPQVLDCCRLMAAILHARLTGQDFSPPPLQDPAVRDIAAQSYLHKTRDQIKSSGHVVATLEAALWSVSKTGNFRDAVTLAVNLGDDADTVGAVTGQIAGATWGYSSIPGEWLEKLAWREKIVEMARSLGAQGPETAPRPVPALTPRPSMA